MDLEDARMGIQGGEKYKERVPELTEIYLEFLRRHDSKCTFFVVGLIAEKYPSIIKMIIDEGHEIACHTYDHKTPLTEMSKEYFKEDLKKNIESIIKAGAVEIYGYRAPSFSLTEDNKWVYEILSEMGLQYSSSVLPAKNPLFGWKEFGSEPQIIKSVLEIPVTITQSKFLNIPFGGGVYFRVLPGFITNYYFNKCSKKEIPVLGYFHPYDIDTEQEKFMHPGIKNNKLFNYFMYYNRKNVFKKLEKILNNGFEIMRYIDYVKLIKKN